MKIDKNGVRIEGMYRGVAPGLNTTGFADADGAHVFIDTKTLVYLYELVRFDLERTTGKTMDELFPVEPT